MTDPVVQHSTPEECLDILDIAAAHYDDPSPENPIEHEEQRDYYRQHLRKVLEFIEYADDHPDSDHDSDLTHRFAELCDHTYFAEFLDVIDPPTDADPTSDVWTDIPAL